MDCQWVRYKNHITIQTPESLTGFGLLFGFVSFEAEGFASVSSIERDLPCACPRNGRTEGGRHLIPESLALIKRNKSIKC